MVFENYREWLAAALPFIFQLSLYLFILVTLLVFLNKRRFQNRKDRWNENLSVICRWVKESIEFYSTHYAHLAAGAFTEDEMLSKLAQLGPVRQHATVQAGKVADPGLDAKLEEFNQAEFQIFNLTGVQPAPPAEEYRGRLDQLRAAGEEILEQAELLRR